MQIVDEAQKPHAAHAPLAFHLLQRPSGVSLLCGSVQAQVHEQRNLEPGASGEQGDSQIERESIDMEAEELSQSDIRIGHNRQRRQEVLAELAVGDPGFSLLQPFKGKRINQNRPSLKELQVEGACVLERHVVIDRHLLDLKRCESGVLQLAEGPFIGIGDEGQNFGANDFVGQLGNSGLRWNLFMRQEQTGLYKVSIKARF